MSVFVSIAAVVVILAVQLLCFRAKRLLLRLLPVILLFAATVVLVILAYAASGWSGLGYIILALFTAILTGVCVVAWGIRWIVRLVRKKKAAQPSVPVD